MVISIWLISNEKMTEVRPFLIDADRARSRANVDFPMPGRAATMIIWPGCSPLVSSSNSAKPVGTPAKLPSREEMASISSRVGCISSDSGL